MRVTPLTLRKSPPAKTSEPAGASERTGALALGFHDVATPVLVLRATRFDRLAPPAVVNMPPAYSVDPSADRATALTAGTQGGSSGVARKHPAGPGSHEVAAPLVALSAARFERAAPPTLAKVPPA